MNKLEEMNDLLEGRTILKYENIREGIDNEHLIYLDSGYVLVFGHQDCEGYVDLKILNERIGEEDDA